MKYSLLIFSSFFITSLSIASTTARSTDIFTESQKETVVKAIDNICGDTWCEGDYDFKFNQFACNKKSSECELTFQFIERSDDKTVKEDLYSEKQVCHFDNIKSFDQLMDGEFSLNQDFYDQVSNCISEREASVTF